MSKQRLSEKKARLCSEIGGKAYRACYTRGGREHFLAECWFGDGETLHDCDWVNYKTREVTPHVRAGQAVDTSAASPVPDVITLLLPRAMDAMERHIEYLIVDDWIFDEYMRVAPTINRISGGHRHNLYEHLMFKAIRIYPTRSHYPGPIPEVRIV